MQVLIVRDAVLRSVLEALEWTACFNEFNVNGLTIKHESQETCAGIRPEDALDTTCRAFGRMLAMNRALVMLDIFGKQIEQQDLDVSATVGSTGSLMLVCSTGGGDCRGNLTDCRPMSGFGRWISLAFLSLPENNTLKLLVIAHNRFGEDGMLTLARWTYGFAGDQLSLASWRCLETSKPS
ncbi:hypothetical protein BGZ89_002925 [Linnemannia elongata]|nr:hypothetical protein BGZ89_002925 [Linnemannia elongata]